MLSFPRTGQPLQTLSKEIFIVRLLVAGDKEFEVREAFHEFVVRAIALLDSDDVKHFKVPSLRTLKWTSRYS